MKKQVLIHTLFHENYNYGGILQAYALYHTLEKMGCECYELNYSQKIENFLKKFFYRRHRILEILKDPVNYRDQKRKAWEELLLFKKYIQIEGEDIRKCVFEKFMKEEFESTELYRPDTIHKLEMKYDFYITGGDQVWNPDWSDKNFFFSYVKKGIKIGYSCSAGKSYLNQNDKDKILKWIKGMHVISVREENLSQILTEAGVENQIICDPVFLLGKNEWEKFAIDKYKIKDNYLFAYLLGNDIKCRKNIKRFANANKLKIVGLPHIWRKYVEADEDFADIQIHDAGPKEFISLIMNADFVLTDSFHGTAFSIIFEKQFLNFDRFHKDDENSLNARIISILTRYGLNDRMVEIDKISSIGIDSLSKINYQVMRKMTMLNKDKAKAFLKEAVKIH